MEGQFEGLKNLRSSGRVKCLGKGQNAEWERTAKWIQVTPNQLGSELGNRIVKALFSPSPLAGEGAKKGIIGTNLIIKRVIGS
jgi:hypothetical protein